MCLCAGIGIAAAAEVTGTVRVVREDGKSAGKNDSANAVISLKPVAGAAKPVPGHFEILQKKKHFIPHLLAIPAGSTVDFPNQDPFFHNVFSLFDGKRFDLGLYESGTSHSVRFDRVGVSYIFCNIHPEMSAIVVALDTPYFAVTSASGQFSIPNVPAGRYLLSVWHERGKPDPSAGLPREVVIGSDAETLSPIRLLDSGHLIPPHKNKYGLDYEPPPKSGIYK